MKLSFNVLGFELATINLDFGDDDSAPTEAVTAKATKATTKAVKKISGLWVRGMMHAG